MSGKGKGRQGTTKGNGKKPWEAKTSTPTVMAADVRAMKPSGAGLAGGGNAQLIAQLVQSLAHPGAPSAGGNTNVQMTPREYSEYVADCAARGKKEETEKEVKLAETIAVAVKAALASL